MRRASCNAVENILLSPSQEYHTAHIARIIYRIYNICIYYITLQHEKEPPYV